MATYISKLLRRGAAISVERGRLVVSPPEGGNVPQDWLKKYSETLVHEILTTLERDAYLYESYSTGRYGKALGSGVALQFLSITTTANPYTIFNARLTRDRDSKAGKKGSKLPDGHFRIGKRHLLYHFWKSTGLKFPRRLASLHDYMGNLRGILFSARRSSAHENRLEKGTITPLEISAAEIHHAFSTDKPRTLVGQVTDNSRTRVPDKDSTPAQKIRHLQPNLATGEINHGNKEISERDYKAVTPPAPLRKRPQDQTDDEWLAECFPADGRSEAPRHRSLH